MMKLKKSQWLRILKNVIGLLVITILFSPLPTLLAQLEHYSAASKNLETILADLRKKSQEIKEQNSILSVKNGILQKQLWGLQQELKSKFIEKQELQAEFRRLDDCLRNEITMVQLLENKLDGLKMISGHHDENDTRLHAEIDRKKDEIGSLRQDVLALNNEIVSLDNQLKMSKQGDSRGWDARKNELTNLLAESKRRIDKKKNILEDIMKDPNSLENQISSLSRLREGLVQDISDLKYGKSSSEEQSIIQKKKEKDLDSLNRELEKLNNQRDALETSLNSIPPPNPQEEKMSEEFKSAINQFREAIKKNKANQLKLKEKIRQLEESIVSEQIEIVHLRENTRFRKIGAKDAWGTDKAERIKMLIENLVMPEKKRREIAMQQRDKEKIADMMNVLSQNQSDLKETVAKIERDLQISQNEEKRMIGASQFMSDRRKEDYNILNDEIDYLKSQQEELTEFLALIQDQLNDDKKISDAFNKEEKRLESDIQLLNGENGSLLKQLIKLKSSLKELGTNQNDLSPIPGTMEEK